MIGSLDQPELIAPLVEMFTKRRLQWTKALDIPQFEGMPIDGATGSALAAPAKIRGDGEGGARRRQAAPHRRAAASPRMRRPVRSGSPSSAPDTRRARARCRYLT